MEAIFTETRGVAGTVVGEATGGGCAKRLPSSLLGEQLAGMGKGPALQHRTQREMGSQGFPRGASHNLNRPPPGAVNVA